ncbi:cytochrome P450 3A24-like [Oppia nitens]|uniref:cytochrome P450 3A24-like n=1 Tax=Oppia nitens TaxID=1686743 RepID=UPI0023D97BD5|nr:cytochrome P450 3A24-like [Oppia nitens]
MIFEQLFSINFMAVIVSLLIGLYFYLTRNYKYWSSRGVPGPKPIVFFGTLWQIFFKPMHQMTLDNGRKFGRFYGTYLGSRPVLLINDPQLTRDMNIKDFHAFVDHNDFISGDKFNDRSLFNLMGDDWKKMRSIISPTFSSGKMRSMHPLIIDCIGRLEQYVESRARTNEDLNVKKTMGNLTMDVIATCAFGTRIDTYGEKSSDFVINAQKAMRGNWRVWAFFLFMTTFPKLLRWSGFQIQDPGVQYFFKSAIKSIVNQRKNDKSGKRRDYLQLMIDAQNKRSDNNNSDEPVVGDTSDEIYGRTDTLEATIKDRVDIDDDDILSTSFLFFVAGYETTASLITYLIYNLALHADCQQKLYEELRKFDGKYDYESIAQMPYLEACVAETLRLHNPVSAFGRIAAQDYTIGDIGITVPKGMLVNFSIQTMHRNPEYYPNPDRWNPERFMPYNRDKLVPYTYMPFGLGPRNCVGMRFALMEAKTAVAYLVNRFKFIRTPKTTVPLIQTKFEFLYNTGDVFVGVELRK